MVVFLIINKLNEDFWPAINLFYLDDVIDKIFNNLYVWNNKNMRKILRYSFADLTSLYLILRIQRAKRLIYYK